MRRLFMVHWLVFLVLRWLASLMGLAEKSILWDTGTTGDGTTTYTQAEATSFWGYWFTPNSTIGTPHASQGVLLGVGGELAVTGTASPVSVATGAAVVEGFPYHNTAAVTVAIPTPAASTRIDRIVLRVSHGTTRTTRITRIAGTEGAGAPALTQVAGTTWDIPLAQASITTGGVITVTDQRTFCYFATKVKTSMLDDAAVTSAKLRNSGALSVIGRSANSSGVPADISATPASGAVLRESGSALGFGTIATAGIADSSVTTAKIADNAVTNLKLRDSAALSVIGRSANSSGDPADIGASAASGAVLRESGSTIGFGTIAAAGIANDAVDNTKLRNSGALSVIGRSANSAGDPADISASAASGAVLRESGSTIGFGQVATAGIADGAVTLAKLAADSVDDTKISNRVPFMPSRKGGDATSWSVFGTTTYTPAGVKVTVGTHRWTGAAASSGFGTITLPFSFGSGALAFASVDSPYISVGIFVSAVNQLTYNWITTLGTETGFDIYWLAIGPE